MKKGIIAVALIGVYVFISLKKAKKEVLKIHKMKVQNGYFERTPEKRNPLGEDT